MEKSIQIASKRSLFSVTFGCGGSGPERAGKPELETFVLLRRFIPVATLRSASRNNSAHNRAYREFITTNVIMITLGSVAAAPLLSARPQTLSR